MGGQPGTLGEIDACVGTSIGLTAGQSCTSGQPGELFTPAGTGGYSTAQVSGTGPNHGLHYVTNPTVTMQLRTQINRRFRSDGDTQGLPMTGDATVVSACGPQQRNHFEVNTVCAPHPGYGVFTDYVWNHEALHMAAALWAAGQPDGDLHARWEPLASSFQSTLIEQADFHRQNAQTGIWAHSICTHTGLTEHFSLWLNQGSGWANTMIAVDEEKEPHC